MAKNEIVTIGVCVPTVRPEAMRAFLDVWSPYWSREETAVVRLYVHEDRPRKSPGLAAHTTLALVQTAQDDIASTLGASEWIVPRGSGACRSFPMLLAWRDGCDYVVTMDDDCHPPLAGAEQFIQRHLEAFRRDRWFRTIGGDEPRGIPYQNLGALPVRVNHGLWSEVPDLDGPTSLVRMREARPVAMQSGHEVVPPGMAFPLCAMNVCYHRDVIPVAYNLLMGLEAFGLDRFDDIWSGLLIKRILDYKGWFATTGEPFVRHIKQSSPFANLRKEALGIEIHERLWDHILDAPLEPGLTVGQAYQVLAERVRVFPERFPSLPCPSGYFPRLSDAMIAWSVLFDAPQS